MIKTKDIGNVKFGNDFHKKVEKLFRNIGMEITHSSFTDEGPDIIALDRETNTKIIIQCKATRKIATYPSIKRLINEYAERRRENNADISVLAFSGYNIKPGINLEEVFAKKGVRFITSELIKEYYQLFSKIGHFAKYQILSDFGIFKDFVRTPLELPALKIVQPGSSFFVCALPVEWLLCATSVYRRIGPKQHIKGYQRILTRKRITKDIPAYLNQKDWVLPNAIILATQESFREKIEFNNGKITLPSKTGFLWVIDGQHRLYSFANVPRELLKEQLLTVIFDSRLMKDRAEATQADIFIKLNRSAQKVSPALVFELLKELLGTKDFKLKVAFGLCDTPVLSDLIKSHSKKTGMIDLVTIATEKQIAKLSSVDGPILKGRKVLDDDAVIEVVSYIESYLNKVKKIFKKEWGNSDYIISDNRGMGALLQILVYFLEKNKNATKKKIIKISEKSFRILKSKVTITSEAKKGQYLGEGGPKLLAKEWIDIFSGSSDSDLVPKREGKQVEFKSTFRFDVETGNTNRVLPQEITRALCAFQNSFGGTVYVGVNDDGEIIGIENDLRLCVGRGNPEDKLTRLITQTLRQDLRSVAAGRVDFKILPYKEKQYIKLSVKPSDKPVYLKRDEFYVRQVAESVQLKGEEMEDYIMSHFNR